jgi:hypothetical protein
LYFCKNKTYRAVSAIRAYTSAKTKRVGLNT